MSDYNEEREVLNTMNMLEEGFFSNLKRPLRDKIAGTGEIEKEVKSQPNAHKVNTEIVLIDLYEVRDEMIESCNELDIGSKLANKMAGNINKLGSIIKAYGGKIDEFDPLASASGLESPDITLNAERVIENTKRAYRLGQIKDTQISKNGKEIMITFAGIRGDMVYKSVGTVSANGTWTGSEAIDYIYSPGEGKMSVKAFSNEGKWTDKSSNFKISWELWEDKVGEEKEEVKTAAKEEKIKEEVKVVSQNNLEEEDIGDFIIEDKDES